MGVQALKIFQATLAYHITIEPEWVPRDQNTLADELSRIIDFDDWSIEPTVFHCLDSPWGPFTVDRFANRYNAQVA